MRVASCGLSVLLVAMATTRANAETTNRLALDLSGTRFGLVLAYPHAAENEIVITTDGVPAPLVSLAASFTQGKPVKRDIRLSSGAVVRKTNDARLSAFKLPPVGAGGVTDIELTFAAAPLTSQPLLSAKEAPPPPPAQRITDFHVDVAGVKITEAPTLDAITISQKSDGSPVTGPIAFETGAGGGPPFSQWQKSNGGKPSPRSLHIEYVGSDGKTLLKLDNDRCLPTSVEPHGANGTTRIVLTCGAVRVSG